MSWEKPNLLPIWEAQVWAQSRSVNPISADRLLQVRGFLQRCSGGARSLVLLLSFYLWLFIGRH